MKGLIALTFLLSFATPVFSQTAGGGPPAIDRRTNTDRLRQQDISRREWQLRNFGSEPGAPLDQRQVKALMAQTEEDFTRILTLHNLIVRALSANDALDYHFISGATGEIKKRASRVQSTLRLKLSEEETEAAKAPQFKDVEMKDALIKLCREIRSFVTNPTIANPSTINADELTKARYDLERLIELSGHISKISKHK